MLYVSWDSAWVVIVLDKKCMKKTTKKQWQILCHKSIALIFLFLRLLILYRSQHLARGRIQAIARYVIIEQTPTEFTSSYSLTKIFSCQWTIKWKHPHWCFIGWLSKCLANNYVTRSCLYAKFHWLISHVTQLLNVLSTILKSSKSDSVKDIS